MSETIKKLDLKQLFSAAAPSLDFVLPGLLAGTVGGIISAGGVGKSRFMLQAAMEVSSNKARTLDLGIQRHGKVVLFTAEDPDCVLHARLQAIKGVLDSQACEEVIENMSIVTTQGLRGSSSPTGFSSTKFVEEIVRYAKKARLIVFDTLSKFHSLDENKASDAKVIIAALEQIAEQTGAAVVYVHHNTKMSAYYGTQDMQQAARGSSVLVDNARWVSFLVGMTREEAFGAGLDEASRSDYLRWNVSKLNYSAPMPDRWYKVGKGGVLLPARIDKRKVSVQRPRTQKRTSSVCNND